MNPIFILVGPSGVGKSTAQEELLTRGEFGLMRAITTTTRKARPGEIEGEDFFFVTPEEFNEMVQKDEFVEWVETFGNCYGTTRKELDGKLAQGPVLMITDMRGAQSIKKQYEDTHIIFLDAPREDLVRRISERPGTSPDDLERRLKRMDEEKAGASQADILLHNPDGKFAETLENVRRFISQQWEGRLH